MSSALRAQMTSQDKEGLTPFARAAANGNISGAKALYDWLSAWEGGGLLEGGVVAPDKLGRQVCCEWFPMRNRQYHFRMLCCSYGPRDNRKCKFRDSLLSMKCV